MNTRVYTLLYATARGNQKKHHRDASHMSPMMDWYPKKDYRKDTLDLINKTPYHLRGFSYSESEAILSDETSWETETQEEETQYSFNFSA